MDDKVEKNKLQIHKEATEWAKKINLVYENLINGSEKCDRKTITDAIRFYGPNFQRLPECVESSIKLMKCFLMSSGNNIECWDSRQKNAFNVFVSAMISQKKEDFIVRKVLGCWSDFLTKLPEEESKQLIHVAKSSKIIKMLFHKIGRARTYYTQMRLVEILHIYSKYLPDGGFKLMEADVKLIGSPQLYDQLHSLFLQINFDDFVDTCRKFLNFYNTYLGNKSGIVSMLGRLRILNHQTFSKNDIRSDFFDFNIKCLSMSFFISKKFLMKNEVSTEWIYVEIEDFEIDAMEFDNFTDPTEKNIQISIHPTKYFILDSAGKTVHNIPELKKLVIEINDESIKKKSFREKVYTQYKNRSKIPDDATTKGDDESMMSFTTYNTDFCNSPLIEEVKNRNLSIRASIHEKGLVSSFNPNIYTNKFNSSPQKLDETKSQFEILPSMSPKHPKQSEDLYSSIDYGRRHENAAFQLEKVIQKVLPMQEKPPKRRTVQFEPIQTSNNSIQVVPNKKVVKLPTITRTEASRKDVYDVIDDGGDSPLIPYQSFISQEREKKKKILQESNAINEIIPDSEDFTLEDNLISDEDFNPKGAKKSSYNKVPVKKISEIKNSTKAAPKRSIQTRLKKETAGKKMKISPPEENVLLPGILTKPLAKTRKVPVNQIKSPIVMKETRNCVKTTRRTKCYSPSENNFEPNKNCEYNESDVDMDVVILPKAPIKAIESLMADKKKREAMKIQEVEKARKTMTTNLTVVQQLKDHPVEFVKKTTQQESKTTRKTLFCSSSKDNFEPNKNCEDNDNASDMDMEVIHPKAPIETIKSLTADKKNREATKNIQEVEKIRKTKKPHLPDVKPLKDQPVEIEKKTTEQTGNNVEKIDSVEIVRNVTFTTRVSPGSSQIIQEGQKTSKRIADVDEKIQCNDMEVDNQQFQKNVQRHRDISTDKRDLSLEYDNEHFKRVSTENQKMTYDPPINYNFDQLKSNKLLNKFISQANNNDNDQQQQHYQESVMVQRTTTIQKRCSIDQAPSNETQIINRPNIDVDHCAIPSTLRESYKTRTSIASAEARKKILSMNSGIVDGIDDTFKESLVEGIEKIGNINKDMKVHCLQHIQLMKKMYHSKKQLMYLKGKSRELILDVSDKLKDTLMQLKESAKHEKKIVSKMGLELIQKEQECKTRAWQCFMDEFLNNVQEETIKHYEFEEC